MMTLKKLAAGRYVLDEFTIYSVIVGPTRIKEWRVERSGKFFGQYGSLALARQAVVDATTQQHNMQFKATFLRIRGEIREYREYTLVLARYVGETSKHYQERFADIVSYKNGALHDIARIQAVQTCLLEQGYSLSNCILTDVGPLEPMA